MFSIVLSPSQLQKTLTKIFQSLKPGGLFIGTLAFISENPKAIEAQRWHFCPNKIFAQKVITRACFQIKDEYEPLTLGHFPSRLEFLARKPTE